ncbi:MAG TPA: glycosyltransferase [Pirellulales bacterium]|nr:glycosyltransferase [Pirellulales bacterium]
MPTIALTTANRSAVVSSTLDVVHVIPYMHPRAGGPPVVVDRLCRKLSERGWTNHVMSTNTFADAGDVSWLDRYGDGYSLEIFPSRGPGSYSFSRALSKSIDRFVAGARLVHLHTAWTHPTWAAMRACRRHHVPYIVMPHGMLDPNSLSRKWLKKQLYGRLVEWPYLRQARAMVYTNAEERRLAEKAVVGLPPGYVVPLASDEPPPEPRSYLAEEFLTTYPDLRGKALVVFLSRLHPKKGLDLLIPGFALLAKCQRSAQLVLVGPGESRYVAQLRQLAELLGIAHRVSFIGPLEGRAKWTALAAAQVFALPSYQENFALVVVEALRMGVPTVISRRINIWDDIIRSQGVAICDLTAQSVADMLLPWLSDPVTAESAGRQGQEFVGQHFTWDRSTEALCQIYADILGAPTAADEFA